MLVVVAIVVIVTSFISAVLDKSLYEAELTRCLADQKSIGVGAMAYAASYQRHYPYRAGVFEDRDWAPNVISSNGASEENGPGVLRRKDDRDAIREYMQINEQLNCAMVKAVDLETTAARSRVLASQAMWFGWQYRTKDGPLKGMLRLGDRFEWNGHSFNVLVSDWTAYSREDNNAIGSHPDFYDGIMSLETVQDQQTFWWIESPLTYSFWISPETSWPGPIDRTFLYDDGSADRLVRVSWRAEINNIGKVIRQDQIWEKMDERMIRVPERVMDDPSRSTHLPR